MSDLRPRIVRLATFRVSGELDRERWQATLPVHPALRAPERAEGIYLQVVGRDGADGWWGPLDRAAAALLPFVSPLVCDLDVPLGELAATLRGRWRHAHEGLGALTLAAVELAAWDLVSTRAGRPVADLLGLRAGPALPAYATLLGISDLQHDEHGPAIAAAVAEAGYRLQKWRLPEGPRAGSAGLARNVSRVAALVRAAAPCRIAIECDRSFTPSYLAAFLDATAHLDGVAWIEEPLPPWAPLPDRPTSHPLAGGEHTYHRGELAALADRLEVLQPDVTFFPGIHEVRAAVADGLARGRTVAIHGNGLPAAAAVLADHAPGSLVLEHHLTLEPLRQGLSSVPVIPRGGQVPAPTHLGFGVRPHAGCRLERLAA